MANEFKIKHGFISTGDGSVEGSLTITGAAYADNGSRIASRPWVTQFLSDNSYATSSDITTAISNLVDSAPGTLNTLNELAAAIGDDASFSTTITNSISTKLPLAGGTMTGNITFTDDAEGIVWSRNTDGASIKFYNTADGDTDSRLEFHTNDNNNEYFRWTHGPSGGALYEVMKLMPTGSGSSRLTVQGDIYAASNKVATETHVSANYLSKFHDITLSLTGDVSGSGTFNNMGDLSFDVQVADDSHNHDGRYYTETEMDTKLAQRVSTSGDTISGSLNITDGIPHGGSEPYTEYSKVIFDNSHNDIARGPNKIVMHDNGAGWSGGFGIHSSTVAYYTGDKHSWYKSNTNGSFTERMALDGAGNLSIDGTLSASGYNKSNWDTAFGWGDHDGLYASTSHTHSAADITSGTLDGARLSGTYTINVSGTSTYANNLYRDDNRTIAPSEDISGTLSFGFTSFQNDNSGPYADYLHLRSYTDVSGGRDNLLMFSKSDMEIRLWQQDFNSSDNYAEFRDVAFKDEIPTNNNQLTNGAGYITAVPSTFDATSIGIGNKVTISESTDRVDLLYINSHTSGWGGLQIGNTSNEFIFSLMGNGNAGGIYDDQNGDWIIYWDENAGVQLHHNSNTKLLTVSDGVNITGRLYASSGIEVPYGVGEHKPMVVLNGATTYGLFHTEATNDKFTFDFNGEQKFQFSQDGIFTINGNTITTGKVTNWDTAHGWGNHASAGYALANTLGSLALEDSVTISEVDELQTALNGKLNLSGGTLSGDLIVGATDKTSDTVVRSLADQSYKAGFEAYGNGQGTGYVYVGQSADYGGGFSYNGDGSPSFVSGETADNITFFRRSAGTSTEVFHYSYSNNDVYFNGAVVASGSNSNNWNTAYGWGDHGAAGYATETWVNEQNFATDAAISTAIGNLIDSSPANLDTLNELAAALGDDANFSTTVTNSLAGKLSTAGGKISRNGMLDVIAASYSYTNGSHLELYTTDNHVPAIGFHRGGVSATTLFEEQGELFITKWNADGTPLKLWNEGDFDFQDFALSSAIPTNNNQLTNGAGYTTNTGTITGVSTGTGLDGTASSGSVTITLDLSELADMTAAVSPTVDEIILLDNGAERRKRFSEIFGSAAYVNTSAFDAAGSAFAVDTRINEEVLPSIPTNVSQLTNDAGYITDGNTGWNNSYGFITSSSNISGTSAGVVKTVSGTSSAELVRGNMGDNDQARILVGASASNAGYLEIATADDGTEPIYVRQYTGVFSTLQRTATLLDGSGNTSFPGTVSASGGNSGNWNTAYGWGNHATAGYASGSFLPLSGGTVTGTIAATGGINMGNSNITNVNHITINDAGYGEGVQWSNWMIYESPDNLSNAAGNFQISNVGDNSIRVTVDANGNLYPSRDRLHTLGKDTNRWQIVFCEILDSAGQHEKNLQNPEGEKSVGEYETGTVLVWQNGKNIPCTEYADHMRMGIAVKGIDSPLIQGAEPVLVTGSVKEGDYLVTSRKEGHAEAISAELMRQQGLYDCVLGKALENGEGESYLVKTWINI